MNKKIVSVLALAGLSACASFTPDFEIKDASETSRPDWIIQSKAHKSDDSDNHGKFRYYVEDSENVNRRLCLKSAETRATQKIAAEIAQELVSKYEEKSVSSNDTSSSRLNDNLVQNIKVDLHGVTVQDKYWEKRRYLKELGAEADKTAYHCNVVVKIANSSLIEALEAYKQKTLNKLKAAYQAPLNEAIDETIAELEAE